MKISRHIKISKKIKFKKLTLNSMKHGRYGKNLYIICTGTKPGYLFEILSSRFLTKAYDQSYVIGVTKTKQEAIEYMQVLIEELFIKGTMTLEELKQTKEGAG